MARKKYVDYSDSLFSEEDFTLVVGAKIDTLDNVLNDIISNQKQGETNELGSKDQFALGSSANRADDTQHRLGANGADFKSRTIQSNDNNISQGYGRSGGLQHNNNFISNEHNRNLAETTNEQWIGGEREQNTASQRSFDGSSQTREHSTSSILQSASKGDERSREYGSRDLGTFGSELGLGLQMDETNARSRDALRESSGSWSNASDIVSTGKNLDFKASDEIIITGKKDKFRKNIEAIKLTRELAIIKDNARKNNHNFTITEEEQNIISKFSGWGALPEVFDDSKEDWKKERAELKELLSHEEYESAKSSCLTAFYTPKIVIDNMYKGLERLGINSDENKKDRLN